MVKEYKESDLDHNPEIPLIARQAIAMALVILIILLAVWVLK